ncbi:hypothetical protein Elgi_31890 [Paenibacillus elgii]|nr:hypothetical protein Elgi_31890 [Paenibacillus elgii]
MNIRSPVIKISGAFFHTARKKLDKSPYRIYINIMNMNNDYIIKGGCADAAAGQVCGPCPIKQAADDRVRNQKKF